MKDEVSTEGPVIVGASLTGNTYSVYDMTCIDQNHDMQYTVDNIMVCTIVPTYD